MEVLNVGMKNVVKCGKCGSTLRFSDSDVRVNKSAPGYDAYEPEDNYGLYVVCPVCPDHPQITVPRNSSLIRQRLEAERWSDHHL